MLRQDEEDVQPAQRRHRQVHRHRRRVELHQPVDAQAQRPPALMDFVINPIAAQEIQVRDAQNDVVQAARRRQVAQNRQGNQHQVPQNGQMDQNRQVGQARQVVPNQEEPQIPLIEQNNQLDQNLQVAEIPGPPHARQLPLHLELLNRFMHDYAQQRIQVPYPVPQPVFQGMPFFIPPGQMMGNANMFMPPPFYINSGHPPVLIQGQFYNIFVQVPNFPFMGPPFLPPTGNPMAALPPVPVGIPMRAVNQYPVLRNPEQQQNHHGINPEPINQVAPERDERRNPVPVVEPVQQDPVRQDEPHALPDVSRMEIGTWQSVPRRLIPGLRRTYPTAGQNFEVTPWNGGPNHPSRQPDLQGASSSSQSTSGPSTSNPSSSRDKSK